MVIELNRILKYGIGWIIIVISSLIFLKLANDVGSIWINVSWAFGVLFGIESVLYLRIIEEYKKEKKIVR